jgi:hypothetical protein
VRRAAAWRCRFFALGIWSAYSADMRMAPAGELWIVDEVARCVRGAAKQPEYISWYRVLLDDLAWLWSVDAYDAGQRVTRDAIKKSAAPFTMASYSHQAEVARLAGQLKCIQRDHVVPKAVLIGELLGLQASSNSLEQDIADVLKRFCFVVFVHKNEHDALKRNQLGSSMPASWYGPPLLQRSPWARYTDPRINLMHTIVRHPSVPLP